MAMCG